MPPPEALYEHTIRRLFVTCDVFTRYFFVAFSWFFPGFFLAFSCLETQCSGLFRGFFVAPVLGKFYAYSPWNSLLNTILNMTKWAWTNKLYSELHRSQQEQDCEIANGGAKRIVRLGGGGGKRTIECPLQNHFGGLRKWDLSGLCPFPPKNMTWREQIGGKAYHKWGGGSKTVFGEGFYGMFSPPQSFFPPFVFLWQEVLTKMTNMTSCKRVLHFMSECRGCLEEGCLGLPRVFPDISWAAIFPRKWRKRPQEPELPDLVWNSQTSIFQTSATTRSWVAKFKGDTNSECMLSNWSRSYREIKLVLSARIWVVASREVRGDKSASQSSIRRCAWTV